MFESEDLLERSNSDQIQISAEKDPREELVNRDRKREETDEFAKMRERCRFSGEISKNTLKNSPS